MTEGQKGARIEQGGVLVPVGGGWGHDGGSIEFQTCEGARNGPVNRSAVVVQQTT